MTRQLQFFGFCSLFIAIILGCILAGGYSSFWRSKNRIEASKPFLTEACQKRMDLLPGLIDFIRKNKLPMSVSAIEQTTRTASRILQQVISHQTPLDDSLIKEFEISQSEITRQIVDIFTQLESLPDQTLSKPVKSLKTIFVSAQNNLFITVKTYNDEAGYYNERVASFLPSLTAKVFGFDKLTYILISKDLFLPAKETFAPKTA